MIKLVAALLLALGSGLIFKALVEIDAPTLRPRLLRRRLSSRARASEAEAVALRRAA